MKSFQRMGGKMLKRSQDQESVSTIINEFKSIENMLERLHRDLSIWRDSWDDILRLSYDCSEAFSTLYKPLEPPPDPEAPYAPRETPPAFLHTCLGLQKLYSEQRADLAQEVAMITSKVMRPVEEARGALKGLGKTLKHRENMKLDYERYLSRAEHARKKEVKSAKDEASLAKCEDDLVQATIDYGTADEQVVGTFPPVSQAVAMLMPSILASQVVLQTTLVGQLYTNLEGFCRRTGMPVPAPSDGEIVGVWEREFTSFRKEVEGGLSLISTGKAVNQSMTLPEKDTSSMTGLGIRNKARSGAETGRGYLSKGKNLPAFSRKSSSNGQPSPGVQDGEEEEAPPQPPRPGGGASSTYRPVNLADKPRMPSSSSVNAYAAAYDQKPSPGHGQKQQPPPPYEQTTTSSYSSAPSPSIASSSYHTPRTNLSPTASTSHQSDYFTDRKPSPSTFAMNSVAAAKKKPPPPVPAKRIPSAQKPREYVTALYDFEGQNEGDLVFREGDKILVVRRTGSTDDWWEGEVGGKRGSFPANYVQL